MSNTLELRSTFHFSERIGEMPSMSITNPTLTKKKLIKNKDSVPEELYQKNEISVASQMVQAIKQELDSEMKSIIEPYVTKRLTSLIKNEFPQGKILSICSNAPTLLGFELGSVKGIFNKFSSKCFIRKGAHKGDVIFDLPAFVPFNELAPPSEATNFKISTKLIALSDFQLDEMSNQYFPLSSEIHGLSGKYETSMLPLIKIQTQPITARLYIDKMKNMDDNAGSVLLTAIKYYKYGNGKFEHLSKSGNMSITKIF